MNQYHLIYDDECPLCTACIESLRHRDRIELVKYVPLSGLLDDARLRPSAIERLKQEVHLITPQRRVYRGAEAVGVLARVLPGSRLIGALVLFPGIRYLARHTYRMVARHRLTISKLTSLN
jgi:predicted DCC family thiol-disulfide oxidoreductase YuxK